MALKKLNLERGHLCGCTLTFFTSLLAPFLRVVHTYARTLHGMPLQQASGICSIQTKAQYINTAQMQMSNVGGSVTCDPDLCLRFDAGPNTASACTTTAL